VAEGRRVEVEKCAHREKRERRRDEGRREKGKEEGGRLLVARAFRSRAGDVGSGAATGGSGDEVDWIVSVWCSEILVPL